MNPETGAPMDELHRDTLDLVKSLQLEYTTLSEILKAGPCAKVGFKERIRKCFFYVSWNFK